MPLGSIDLRRTWEPRSVVWKWLALSFVGLSAAICLAEQPIAPEANDQQPEGTAEAVPFATSIAPTLATQCLQCHGPNRQESGLALHTREALEAGGDRGPTLIPGNAESSLLLQAIDRHHDELQMPPEGDAFSDEQVEVFRKWINAGAIWPDDYTELSTERPITDEDRSFWSFSALTDPQPPTDPTDAWSKSDIDRFIWRAQKEAGLHPMGAADRASLLRRVYFDLIGLPPTPDEVAAFLQDSRTDAFARHVDQLLDRPEYGQRWARHWLDLVRYAESDGFKADVFRPLAWRYRDYVVRSLNEDKPYDRFIQEQIAGDELFPNDAQARIATGYLRLWPLEDNQKDVQRQWKLILHDVTEVTSEAILGLGMKCARCHDHKFDPISQQDYYRLQAFFAAMLPRDDLEVPLSVGESRQQFYEWESESHEVRSAMRRMMNQHVASQKKTIEAYPPYLQTLFDTPVDQWSPAQRQLAYLARPQVTKRSNREIEFRGELQVRWQRLQEQMAKHDRRKPNQVSKVMAVSDVGRVAPSTHVANDPNNASVEPGFLSVLTSDRAPMLTVSGDTTGRRATLAKWLTSPENPLTARVIVNRVWQQHFGRGIVTTANDFGRQGQRPSHPLLLDWLASRFIEDGWSLKKLHRRIVTSATYQQATLLRDADLAETVAGDSENTEISNKLFRGRVPRRLAGDQIRDAMLAVSGELLPYQSAPSADGDKPVRSIQVKNVRNTPDEFLNAFDGPDMFNSCARRFVTTTPVQSLLVLNSPWTFKRAEAMARRIAANGDDDLEVLAEQAIHLAYSRPASSEEIEQASQFLIDAADVDEADNSLVDLCHVLLCSNEFVYVD